jgi:hypothetical protein
MSHDFRSYNSAVQDRGRDDQREFVPEAEMK